MSTTRTQVYLSAEQRERIDAVVRSEGLTLAEVVRRALDAYLAPDAETTATLDATFGADPVAQAPDREEWNRGRPSH